jgi:hypothetical protein
LIDEDHARPRQHAFNQPAAFSPLEDDIPSGRFGSETPARRERPAVKVTAAAVVYEVTKAQAYLA